MALSVATRRAQGTAMCVGLPGQVLEVDDRGSARVDVQGAVRQVSLALVAEPPRVGDWVLVQLGFVMSRITEEEATETLRLLRLLEASVSDELSMA